VLGIAACAWQLRPPADSGFAVGWKTNLRVGDAVQTLDSIWRSYAPLPRPTRDFWSTNLLDGHLSKLEPILALAAIGIAIAILKRRRTGLFFYVAGTAAMLVFGYAKYLGFIRHWGHYYLLLVAALWLAYGAEGGRSAADDATTSKPAERPAGWKGMAITALFAVQFAAGMVATITDWVRPFSQGRDVAQYIRKQGLIDRPIVGTKEEATASLSAWLDVPVYHADSERRGSFMRWDQHRHSHTPADVVAYARTLRAQTGRPPLLVFNYDPGLADDGEVKQLKVFDAAIVTDERFWVYSMGPAAPTTQR